MVSATRSLLIGVAAFAMTIVLICAHHAADLSAIA